MAAAISPPPARNGGGSFVDMKIICNRREVQHAFQF
jgi:hypothetical protein